MRNAIYPLILCSHTCTDVIYRIAGKFGGGKVWRIWRIWRNYKSFAN